MLYDTAQLQKRALKKQNKKIGPKIKSKNNKEEASNTEGQKQYYTVVVRSREKVGPGADFPS